LLRHGVTHSRLMPPGTTCVPTLEHVEISPVPVPPRAASGGVPVAVPAHRFLWSARDDAHYRGATATRCQVLRGRPGGERIRFGVSRRPGRAIGSHPGRRAGTDREDLPPRWLNGALAAVNRLELACGRVLRPPTGTSLVAVARRPSAATRPGGAEVGLP
jgi:hypothetical protein